MISEDLGNAALLNAAALLRSFSPERLDLWARMVCKEHAMTLMDYHAVIVRGAKLYRIGNGNYYLILVDAALYAVHRRDFSKCVFVQIETLARFSEWDPTHWVEETWGREYVEIKGALALGYGDLGVKTRYYYDYERKSWICSETGAASALPVPINTRRTA